MYRICSRIESISRIECIVDNQNMTLWTNFSDIVTDSSFTSLKQLDHC